MARPWVVWLVSLPLAGTGWLAAHWLACLLVAPAAGPHERVHGYMVVAPLLVAFAATLLLAGVALTVLYGLRGHARPRIPVVPLLLLPPLGFAAQEHLERLIELNAIPLGTALEPTFLVGMGLQLPFALAAFGLARLMSGLGYALGRELAGRRRAPHALASPVPRARPAPAVVRPSVLATGYGERAPPAPAAA